MCQFVILGVYFLFGLFWVVFGMIFLLEFFKELLKLIELKKNSITYFLKKIFYMSGMIILFSLMTWFGLKVLFEIIL